MFEQTQSEQLRVLILAPGCDGTDVGESWSCHQWVEGLSRHCQVTLLTLHRLERLRASEQLPHVEVIEWEDFRFGPRMERITSMAKLGYVRFYRQANRWFRAARRAGRHFDLVHQLGPLAMRYPSPAATWGIPYIVGPLAGSLETPAKFRSECGSAPWYTQFRRLDQLRFQFDPWLRRTYSRADAVIGVAPYVKELLNSIPIKRFELASETGISHVSSQSRSRHGESGVLRLLYVGRIVRTKGLLDLVRALGQLTDRPGITLDVAGQGEGLSACQDLAKSLGLESRIRFHGRLPRPEVNALYESADVFAFPSFREPSGNVVFEALSHGLPVITTNRGGPGYVVNDDCGIRLDAQSPQQLAADLARSIRELADDPDRCDRLAAGALERAREVGLWENKIDDMLRLYRDVVPVPQNQMVGVCVP